MKITKRDIKFFFAGVLAFMVFSFVYDWGNNVRDAKEAFNVGYNDATKVENNE